MHYWKHSKIILAMSFLTGGSYGCALYSPSQNQAVTKDCNIPTDQSGTIIGRWAITPIPIAFHQGDFSSDEMTAMTQAADTWNQFFTASKNMNTLDYGGNPASPKLSATNNPAPGVCAQGIIQNNQFTGSVVIYKSATWPASYAATQMALTTTCFLTQSKPYPTIFMAIMEINYQNFFISGKKLPDLQSIILHELGHLHGLNHSCEASPGTGTPNCNTPNLNPDYLTASLFPSFSFDSSGQGEQRRQLGVNDQSRVNCLYNAK